MNAENINLQNFVEKHWALRFGVSEVNWAQLPTTGSLEQALMILGYPYQDRLILCTAFANQTLRSPSNGWKLWPHELIDFRWKKWQTSFLKSTQNLGFYAVVPDANWVAKLVDLAVPTIQLRYKSKAGIVSEIRRAVSYCEGSQSKLFVNDYWRYAIEANAYGVHLGQEDILTADLEAIRRHGLRLGISTHTYDELRKAYFYQPSYIALGAIFPTTLKNMPTPPQGIAKLKNIVQLLHSHVPVVAIGGINAQNVQQVLSTGVKSIAVVRAITESLDLKHQVDFFKEQMAILQRYDECARVSKIEQ
ncbi:MAG: thiamine phosphate synthase [Gammaproteobacteria bacterium]|nr:thiamine phosphate synthase [Gammaproteobacteria bacterium]